MRKLKGVWRFASKDERRGALGFPARARRRAEQAGVPRPKPRSGQNRLAMRTQTSARYGIRRDHPRRLNMARHCDAWYHGAGFPSRQDPQTIEEGHLHSSAKGAHAGRMVMFRLKGKPAESEP